MLGWSAVYLQGWMLNAVDHLLGCFRIKIYLSLLSLQHYKVPACPVLHSEYHTSFVEIQPKKTYYLPGWEPCLISISCVARLSCMNASVGGRERYGAENDYLPDSQTSRWREVWWWLVACGHYGSGSLPWRLQFYSEPQLWLISPSYLPSHVMSPVYHE